jgi:hypothetical protein
MSQNALKRLCNLIQGYRADADGASFRNSFKDAIEAGQREGSIPKAADW